MKRFLTVVILFAGFLALVLWVLIGLRPKSQDPEAVNISPPQATTQTVETTKAPPPSFRDLIPLPKEGENRSSQGTRKVRHYSRPFRPKSELPQVLHGNLHAQQLLIVLEEAQVNPAIIQLEFKNIYNNLGAIKDLQVMIAQRIVDAHTGIENVLQTNTGNPDAIDTELNIRDMGEVGGTLSFGIDIEEHRQSILSALAGTKIASDPELQKKLFDINVRLVLSPEASEFMKSYSPITTTQAP
ncbi:MAG: hypothetical protein RIS76_428 [Verrucomicrobiota bacterium]